MFARKGVVSKEFCMVDLFQGSIYIFEYRIYYTVQMTIESYENNRNQSFMQL